MARIFLALASLSLGLLVANVIVGFNVGDLNGITATYLDQQKNVRRLERAGGDDARLREAQRALAETTREFQGLAGRQNVHFLLGVLAALMAILINSISVTYFIGTGRWCQEVVDTYQLDGPLVRSKAQVAAEGQSQDNEMAGSAEIQFEARVTNAGIMARSKALKRRTFPWSLAAILLILSVATLGAASDPGANQGSALAFVPWHRIVAILTTCFVGWSFLVQVGSIGANYEIINEILQRVHEIRVERGLEEAD